MSLQDSPSLDDFKEGLEAGSQRSRSSQTRRMIIYALLAALGAVIVWNQVSSRDLTPQQGTAVVVGRVVDENGQPLPAEVMVFGTNIQTAANAAGEFRIDDLSPGEVLLVIGYDDTAFQQTLILEPGEILDVGEIQYVTTQVPGG